TTSTPHPLKSDAVISNIVLPVPSGPRMKPNVGHAAVHVRASAPRVVTAIARPPGTARTESKATSTFPAWPGSGVGRVWPPWEVTANCRVQLPEMRLPPGSVPSTSWRLGVYSVSLAGSELVLLIG